MAELPTPRLELRATVIEQDGYDWLWEYSLIYRHFLGDEIRIPMGTTRQGGGHHRGFRTLDDLPIRDGAHFMHDVKEFNCRGFVFVNNKCIGSDSDVRRAREESRR